MSPTDPPSPSSRRQPSLIDVPNAESAAARRAPSLRMLDGLDETTSRRAAKAPASGFPSTQAVSGFGTSRVAEPAPAARGARAGWVAAAGLALFVLAVLWWWTQGRADNAATDERRDLSAAPAAAVPLPGGLVNSDAPPTALAAAPVAAPIAAPEPARIETVREPEVAAAVPATPNGRTQSGTVTGASVAPTSPAMSAATAATTPTPTPTLTATAAPTATARAATATPFPLNAAAPATNRALPLPGQVAQAPAQNPSKDTPAPSTSRAPATAAAPSPTVGTAPALAAAPSPARSDTPAADGTRTDNRRSADADVTLIDALLSRIGAGDKGAAGAANAAPRPAIGDLIERCESRAGKETPEAAACRPRLCADQWGKSDACPAALAPKKE